MIRSSLGGRVSDLTDEERRPGRGVADEREARTMPKASAMLKGEVTVLVDVSAPPSWSSWPECDETVDRARDGRFRGERPREWRGQVPT